MEISFSDRRVQNQCCCRKSLVQQFGSELAKRICTRLALLAAARSLDQVPVSPPISLSAIDGTGTFAVALGEGHQLLFQAQPSEVARARALEKISAIQIIGPTPVPAARGKKK